MRKNVTKQTYQQARRKGQRNLRRLLVLFYLFLLCYCVLGYFVLDMVFLDTTVSWFWTYVIKAGGLLFVWWLIVSMLWRFRRIGRTLFTLCSIVSIYAIKDMSLFLEYTIDDQILKVIQYLFCALLVMKTILGLACMLKMRSDPYLRSIWSCSIVYEEELDDSFEEEEQQEPQIPFQREEKPIVLRLQENTPLVLTARKHIRINTWLLAFACYGGFLIWYLGLVFLQLSNREDIGLVYVQRTIMLSTLFSILAWLLPITSMFLYLRITKLMIAIAWCAELVRFLCSIPTLYDVFTTQRYSFFSLFMYISIEATRYFIFYKLSRRLMNDPFVVRYWSHEIKSQEAYE